MARRWFLTKLVLQSSCFFTNYFLGRLPCKVGQRRQLVGVYFREVSGNNFKNMSLTFCTIKKKGEIHGKRETWRTRDIVIPALPSRVVSSESRAYASIFLARLSLAEIRDHSQSRCNAVLSTSGNAGGSSLGLRYRL